MNPAGTFAEHNGSIVFPHQQAPVKHFALDIGGSLVKLVYFATRDDAAAEDQNDAGKFIGGKLHFIKFETRKIDECIEFIRSHDLLGKKKTIKVTGGGAFKYADLFQQKLGVEFARVDEMDSLISGTNFLLQHVPDESFTCNLDDTATADPRQFCPIEHERVFPYLLVNIGSGVSIVRVENETSYKRIDGTSLGGGTFWGLCNLVTGVDNFDDMLQLSTRGDNTHIDLTVGDIYGQDYGKIGLPSHIIASTFGKVMYEREKERKQSKSPPPTGESQAWKKEDIISSLLKMICNNIAQIAYHNAMRAGIHRIYFGGFFIRNHLPTMRGISAGIKYWSQGSIQALFLLHEGYLGALGAFLKGELQKAPALPPPVQLPPQSQWANFLNFQWSIDPVPTTQDRNAVLCDCGCDFCEGLVCKRHQSS